jgi:glycosyltransferase involved in cell wall biosynthesis
VRIALVYDCISPPSVGGAERWLRALAEDLARDHDVTYLTRRQWRRGEPPIPGVRCIAVSPGGPLTTRGGRRRFAGPLAFAAGVLLHLASHRGRYDVVHCLSYPYLPVLSARLALAGTGGPALLVEWLECLTPGYWRAYGGQLGGRAGIAVQRLCVHATPTAICFSRHTERRLREEGLSAPVKRLGGLWQPGPPVDRAAVRPPAGPPFVLFAGRHVADKQVTAIPPALALARRRTPDLRAVIVGDGPLRASLERSVAQLGLEAAVEIPGFVSDERLGELMSAAACVVVASRRDGHGMVAAEAIAAGAPVVAIRAPDSAVPELIAEGQNGAVARSAGAEDLAEAIGRVLEGGEALRERTERWWLANRSDLSAATSIERVRDVYAALSGTAERLA